MFPLDNSDPKEFEGVDYAVFFRGSAIYDANEMLASARDELGKFFAERGVCARKCHTSGLGSAAGPQWMDVLNWAADHQKFLWGLATGLATRLARVPEKVRGVKRRLDDRVLDPYKPAIIVELGARTIGDDGAALERAQTSYNSLLALSPDIQACLRKKFPEQSFALRVRRFGKPALCTFFHVEEIQKSDAANVIRLLRRHKFTHTGIGCVLVYRQFGFRPKVKPSRKVGDYMEFALRC